jgi:hypothetical protein
LFLIIKINYLDLMEGAHNKTLTLNNGETMPTFGLGTYNMKDSATIAKSILELDY